MAGAASNRSSRRQQVRLPFLLALAGAVLWGAVGSPGSAPRGSADAAWGTTAVAAVPAPPVKPDRGELRGSWRVVEVRTNLKPGTINLRRIWAIEERTMTWWGVPTPVELTYAVHPAAEPRRIELTVTKSAGAAAIPTGTTYHGVYVLHGDRLKIAYDVAVKDFPQAFPAEPAGGGVIVVLQRLPEPPPATTRPWLDRPRDVAASALRVELVPAARAERRAGGLALAVTIANRSAKEVTVALTHEWHGGEHPPTNLYAAARPCGGRATAFHPTYLYGEQGGAVAVRTLAAGEAREVAIRLDWPGTGSVPAEPLVGPKAAGPHLVQLLLVFTAEGRRQYVVGPECAVDVPDR